MKRDRIETVRTLLERAVRTGSAPSMIAAWRHVTDPTANIVTVGRARVNPSSVPVTTDTWFDLASLTKPVVVGTLSLLAMREGRLAPATLVADVLPETSDVPVGSRSVVQLLTHTAGLPAWAPLYALAPGRPDRVLESIMGLKVGEANAQVVYSCPGFILLGIMLERLTTTSLDTLFTDWVLQPLSLTDSIGFRPVPTVHVTGEALYPGAEQLLMAELGFDQDLIPTVSAGQPDDGNSRFLGGVAGNAGLFGTAAGVLALAMAYLGAGEFLSPDEISLAGTDYTTGLEQARGLGWQLARSPGCSAGPALDPTAFGHTGFTGTSLWLEPTRGIAMTLLTNRVHPGHRATDLHPLRRRFHQLVVDDLS